MRRMTVYLSDAVEEEWLERILKANLISYEYESKTLLGKSHTESLADYLDGTK